MKNLIFWSLFSTLKADQWGNFKSEVVIKSGGKIKAKKKYGNNILIENLNIDFLNESKYGNNHLPNLSDTFSLKKKTQF